MRSLARLNGRIMDPEEAAVPIWDRGFLFGDAVYEVFRLYDGRCWLEREHYARLERSLREIRIAGIDLAALRERIRETIDRSEVREGTVYVQITRGAAPRRHAFPNPPVPPTELIVVRPFDVAPIREKQERGVSILSRPDLRWGRCDIKSTNLLANVLALQEAEDAGCFEAALVDRDGFVTEATHSSLLWVRDGVLVGTPEGAEILPGTTRHFVDEIAPRAGLQHREDRIRLEDLRSVDEILLVGTTCEVMPVVRLDDRPIGDGAPGPFTRRLVAEYRAGVERWLAAEVSA